MTADRAAMEDSHRDRPPSIREIGGPTRRLVLQGPIAASLGALLAGCASSAASSRLGFAGVPTSSADEVVVPAGYVAQVIARWGEPVGVPGAMPAWRPDASDDAAAQALQLGMHHDGMHYFPLGGDRPHGLLAINHEYVDEGLLFPDGKAGWSAAKVAKAQAAHGIAVVEVEWVPGGWRLVRPSRYARRLTAATPFEVRGPAAGHPLMRTAADPAGTRVLGTLNNCGAGLTPWGTYLSGEENWAGYFDGGDAITPDQRRWGLRARGWSDWAAHDERFDAARHPNEFHRFGWVVEVDPTDPDSVPVKRTALGRAAHEGAWVALTADGRAVVYSGEDARFEYIYKFVSRDRMVPGGAKANATLLDHGTLHVARFDADGRGRWLPLVHGQGPLTAAQGFADAGAVAIRTRQAADLLGATPMDRPEWLAIDRDARTVYCSLTNNSQRGAAGKPGVDAANPRANNAMGHIVRWTEDGDFDARTFSWNHLLLAGDPDNARAEARGTIRGDAFACPDGLAFDPRGLLWISTDVGQSAMHRGEFAGLGNNQLLACDVASGEVRRFLTGPRGCEIAGVTFTLDARTMFVNIQHPGESPAGDNDPADPMRHSRWPDGQAATRPRSATLAVWRRDGGPVGG